MKSEELLFVADVWVDGVCLSGASTTMAAALARDRGGGRSAAAASRSSDRALGVSRSSSNQTAAEALTPPPPPPLYGFTLVFLNILYDATKAVNKSLYLNPFFFSSLLICCSAVIEPAAAAPFILSPNVSRNRSICRCLVLGDLTES